MKLTKTEIKNFYTNCIEGNEVPSKVELEAILELAKRGLASDILENALEDIQGGSPDESNEEYTVEHWEKYGLRVTAFTCASDSLVAMKALREFQAEINSSGEKGE